MSTAKNTALAMPATDTHSVPHELRDQLATIAPKLKLVHKESSEEPAPIATQEADRTETEQEETAASASAPLPSLDDLPTIAPLKELGRAIDTEIGAKKQWLRQAAPKLLEYDTALRELDRVAQHNPDDIAMSSTFREQVAAAQAGIDRLTAIDDEMLYRLDFAKTLEAIRRCDHMNRTAVQAIIDEVAARERYKLVTRGEIEILKGTSEGIPKRTIFFSGNCYIPAVFEEPAPGQYALEVELSKLVMKARGGNRSKSDLLAGRDGHYYLHCRRAPRDRCDGHALVKIYDENAGTQQKPRYILHVIDSMGNVAAMANPKNGPTSIPLEWVKEDRITANRRLTPFEFERAKYLIWRFRSMLDLKPPDADTTAATE